MRCVYEIEDTRLSLGYIALDRIDQWAGALQAIWSALWWPAVIALTVALPFMIEAHWLNWATIAYFALVDFVIMTEGRIGLRLLVGYILIASIFQLHGWHPSVLLAGR